MRTLFLNPPSYDDFDGGAGSRYQAKREVWSFWYPTWLCYPAGMLPGARVLDAPPHDVSLEETVRIARDFDLVVVHTSTPSFRADVRTAQAIKDAKPGITIGFVGGHVTAMPEDALRYGVRDKSVVRVRITGDRELVFGDVLVRVDPSFALAMHIDTDEANAANVKTGAQGFIEGIQNEG